MKFTERYRPLQRLADGTVETTIALDTTSQEQVVIHVFGYPLETANPRNAEDILGLFAALGAVPASQVIDGGTFDGTAFAYVVTKWPGDNALAMWVRSYQDRLEHQSVRSSSTTNVSIGSYPEPLTSESTGEISVRPTPLATSIDLSEKSSPSEVSKQYLTERVKAPAHDGFGDYPSEPSDFFQLRRQPSQTGYIDTPASPAGEFTRQFFSGEAGAGHAQESVDSPPDMQCTINEPKTQFKFKAAKDSAFNSQLFGRTPPVQEDNPVRPKLGTPLLESIEAGQFTELFFKSKEPASSSVPSKFEGSNEVSKADPGEFTSFFSGPFSGERSSVPSSVPVDLVPKEKPSGEFTKVFGTSQNEPSPVALPEDHFGKPQQSTEILVNPTPSLSMMPSRGLNQSHDSQMANLREVHEGPHGVSVEKAPSQPDLVRPVHHSDELANATQLFNPRHREPSGYQSSLPPRESEWTKFQASSKSPGGVGEEYAGMPESGQRDRAGRALEVAAQYTPPAPSLPTPAQPAIPPAPVPALVQPTVLPAPPMPGVPAASPNSSSPQQGPASYWPMIIVINVVFILAVLLILYFALKH